METVTYRLDIASQGNSFYDELSEFTGKFLNHRPGWILHDIRNFITFLGNDSRSMDEHYLEYLTLGTLLRKYSANAMSSGIVGMYVLKFLYLNRNRVPVLKPAIDKIRGYLSTIILGNSFIKLKIDNAFRVKHFIRWMDATGEFSEETLRLRNWQKYLKQLSDAEQKNFLKRVIAEASRFEKQAAEKLGAYTRNVNNFRAQKLADYKFRENYIFCGRYEVEYHLNMLGAEILNRALKEKFDTTQKKVILFPTCMSKPKDGKCKAKVIDSRLMCTACSPECNINIKRWEYSSANIGVVLIPHSSEFTRFLKQWQNQDSTGIVGVACVLNLLKGGYEMQKLNIPSQCVYLDYCGCKKHWHKNGIPTNINAEQLQRIVG